MIARESHECSLEITEVEVSELGEGPELIFPARKRHLAPFRLA